ncbi:ABC transporter permease [Cytobacillus spongiae]|uniref:FtsX-like permease family protein n=1 Tax=Cytobacillus spongiae TaxID=2901381 RepID=UPI001F3FD674|nr:ABC transporter permease [Cytobacillus spongiae]UII54853.1 ABC transporter permease [Cytobacillus spongiae]
MNLAWKEMKQSKTKFFILGLIIFLVSLLTFIISGLANGLSYDNAALIKNLPNGQFLMMKDAKENYTLSRIDDRIQGDILKAENHATAFSIQMGLINDSNGKQHSVAFVTATDSPFFPSVRKGEIILDRSMEDEGVKRGDALTNIQFGGAFAVTDFVEESKFSHAPVAFIHAEDFYKINKIDGMQLIFVPDDVSLSIPSEIQAFQNADFLNTLTSYRAEQLSLNMIIWFLVIITGMLFGIFFYMMNIQKVGLYGILKAIGVRTSDLFRMMWTQMIFITLLSISFSVAISQLMNSLVPKGMPYLLPVETTIGLSGIFFTIGFIGATVSGFQIKKIEPLHAIQQVEG